MVSLAKNSSQEAAAQAAASGLVLLSTSQTNDFGRSVEKLALKEKYQIITIDGVKMRLSRLRKNVGVTARLFDIQYPGRKKDKVVFVTLTYSGTNEDWKPKHLSGFIDCLRKWCKRRSIPCRYISVAELQKRGVIHYHVAIWIPRNLSLPKPDKQGWWKYGMSNIAIARKPVAYLMKYLSKDTSKCFGAFPKGARIYSVGGLKDMRNVRRWLNYPRFIKCRSDITDRWKRVPGGGWASPDGEIFQSEYEPCFVAGERAMRRVHEHEKLINPSGAFCWIN